MESYSCTSLIDSCDLTASHEDGEYRVWAAPLIHSVQSIGYVIERKVESLLLHDVDVYLPDFLRVLKGN